MRSSFSNKACQIKCERILINLLQDPKNSNGAYYIKDLGSGYGVFSCIDKPMILEDSQLINLCQTYIGKLQIFFIITNY